MKSQNVLESLTQIKKVFSDDSIYCSLAIGMFDGIHKGHKKLISSCVKQAKKNNGLSIVWTFTNHPSKILKAQNSTSMIMSLEDRIDYIFSLGVDYVIAYNFTKSFSQKSAKEFVELLKNNIKGLKTIHIGENFKFGKQRSADAEAFSDEAKLYGIKVNALKIVKDKSSTICSTRIRQAIVQGEMETASNLLGRNYKISSFVKEGKKLGRTIGFATLNLQIENEIKPSMGVYVVLLRAKKKVFQAVANYGLRPSVEKTNEPLLEVHILNYETSLGYGDFVEVEFLEKIRQEKKFDSLVSLTKQIEKDKNKAKQYFEKNEFSKE